MPRLEESFEEAFCRKMRKSGWMDLKGDRTRRGFSDRFFFGYGPRTVLVEFKRKNAPKKRTGEKLQDHYREEFRKRNYECYKVEDSEDADELCVKLCLENTYDKAIKRNRKDVSVRGRAHKTRRADK